MLDAPSVCARVMSFPLWFGDSSSDDSRRDGDPVAARRNAKVPTGDARAPTDDAPKRDATWVYGIRAGSRSAFAALYAEYLPAMIGFAYHYVRSADVAEDLAADVFVAIWERRAQWD